MEHPHGGGHSLGDTFGLAGGRRGRGLVHITKSWTEESREQRSSEPSHGHAGDVVPCLIVRGKRKEAEGVLRRSPGFRSPESFASVPLLVLLLYVSVFSLCVECCRFGIFSAIC